MLSKILRTLIIGPPGSGKGTISRRIVKDFGMKHLSSGDLLRKQIAQSAASGLMIKNYLDEGKLVPDNVMEELFLSELKSLHGKSWLLDGFPRTLPQAAALHATVEPVDIVVYLKVPSEVIIDRIKQRLTHIPSGRVYHTEFNPPTVEGKDDITGEVLTQRHDDKPETVQQRLEIFQSVIEPVLNFYRNKNILTEFKGRESNELWPRVHNFIATKKTPSQFTEYN